MAALAGNVSTLSGRQAGWIYKPSWDLPVLILSAGLVPLPFLVAWGAQVSGWARPQQAIDLINIVVATLIGGPHLFSTVTFTLLDEHFRARHPRYLAAALLLPLIVLYLGITHYTILITFFFTWASLHVLHQVIYLTDCYRERSGRQEAMWSRAVDYGLILSGLYPIGLFKIALGDGMVVVEILFSRVVLIRETVGVRRFQIPVQQLPKLRATPGPPWMPARPGYEKNTNRPRQS